ncbi:MAG: nicotinamide mononucleotide transporter [Clostridia bacterium]|nr:nicotinamide mononucleotide transporter [Clostridia bacterium]
MLKRLFRVTLTPFELSLWGLSVAVVTGTALIFGTADALSLAASLIGVTALILVAKGHALGQLLTIVFAVLYGIISLRVRYYGEMITYLGMTAPMALLALVTWLRNPYRDSQEVAVHRMSAREAALMLALTVLTTAAFYFILRAMGNAALAVSTLSVTTSFLASYLPALRSPYYALCYAMNDLVLIVLWVISSLADPSGVPMVGCFAMFFLNDMYGFVNWRRMARRQGDE